MNKKQFQALKREFLKTLFLLKKYSIKNNCSIQFTVTLIDILKNAFITQNKAIIREINEMLSIQPYNKELKAKIKEYYFLLKLEKQNEKNREKENLSIENFLKEIQA